MKFKIILILIFFIFSSLVYSEESKISTIFSKLGKKFQEEWNCNYSFEELNTRYIKVQPLYVVKFTHKKLSYKNKGRGGIEIIHKPSVWFFVYKNDNLTEFMAERKENILQHRKRLEQNPQSAEAVNSNELFYIDEDVIIFIRTGRYFEEAQRDILEEILVLFYDNQKDLTQ